MVINGARGRVALLLLVCAAARPAFAGDGLLQNGNFEYAPDGSQMNGTRVTGPHAIPNWESTGFVEYIDSGTTQGGMVLSVPEGAHAVRLGLDSSVRQQLSVTNGTYYSVTFSAARTCAQSEKLRLSVIPGLDDDAPSELPIQTVYSTSGWDSYSWAFIAAPAQDGAVTLVIHHADDGVDDPACGPIIDAVAIKTLTIPNPPYSQDGSGGGKNDLLRNGGFEEGPYMIPGSAACGVLVPPMDEDAVSPLPGWMVMSYSKAVKYVDVSGTRAVELVAGVEAALVQEVETVPGADCRMEFSVGDAGDGCAAACDDDDANGNGIGMRVTAAAGEASTSVAHCSKGGRWERGVLEFKAVESRTRVVLFSAGYHTRSDGSGTLCGPVVDDVSLVCASSTPPPARRRLLRRR